MHGPINISVIVWFWWKSNAQYASNTWNFLSQFVRAGNTYASAVNPKFTSVQPAGKSFLQTRNLSMERFSRHVILPFTNRRGRLSWSSRPEPPTAAEESLPFCLLHMTFHHLFKSSLWTWRHSATFQSAWSERPQRKQLRNLLGRDFTATYLRWPKQQIWARHW